MVDCFVEMLPGSETLVTGCHCVKQHEGVPEHMDKVVHIIEWLKRLMESVWMGPSSYIPCDSWVRFTVGQALVLPHYHGSGTTPSRPWECFGRQAVLMVQVQTVSWQLASVPDSSLERVCLLP